MEDIFIDIKSKLEEFIEKIYIDYERESIFLEVHKDYLDEVIKLLKNSWLELDIIFQKELNKDRLTIIACVPCIVDIFEQ